MESSKRIKTKLTTSKTILDLPSDALLLILSRLEQKDLKSLSLVSKPFLDLSSRFVRKLTFKTLPDDRSFTQIFSRFSSVNQITLKTMTRGVARSLTAISKSELNLEALKITSCLTDLERRYILGISGKLTIKSLDISVKDDQVVEFLRMSLSLNQQLDGFSCSWDDAGIKSLASMVPNLRKIDLSGNLLLTDRALKALSVKCVNLEYIGIEGCKKFTSQGFCTFLLGCRNLRYLDLPYFLQMPASTSNLRLAETVAACGNIHHLSIDLFQITDAVLCIIAKSRASLKSLKMKSYNSRPNIAYTMTGLSALLCAFKGLTRLAICLPLPETDKFIDKKMSEHVKSLPCLNGIALKSFCPIYSTLFSLIENCPLMECIYLNMNVSDSDRHRKVFPVPRLIRKNYTVKYISLLPSPDASFKIALASFCPSLKNWDESFPSEAFFPYNPAVDRTYLGSDCWFAGVC